MATMQELIAAAAAGTDFTDEKKGGSFERELPEAGMAVCRFREYIELGMQPTASAKYPAKKPALKARFVFELTTPKHVREIEKEDKSIVKIPHLMSVEAVISASEKSNFIKLFRQLNWKGTATHPAQCLGDPFLAEIVHAWKDGDDKAKTKPTYANMMKDGMYTLAPARKVDPLAGTTEELKVPGLIGDLRIFLWDNPTKETWDSLFIDGTYERDGKEVSKNWMQEKIMAALDFETSALAAMEMGDLPTEEPAKEEPKKKDPKKDKAPAKKETASEDAGIEEPKADAPVDPLANLGI
jgi:hypothetical protein